MTKLEEAIIAYWGKRCPDSEPGCPICDAWAEYDALAGMALDQARTLAEIVGRAWSHASEEMVVGNLVDELNHAFPAFRWHDTGATVYDDEQDPIGRAVTVVPTT